MRHGAPNTRHPGESRDPPHRRRIAVFAQQWIPAFAGMTALVWFAGKVLVGWGVFPGLVADVSEFDAATSALSFQLTLQPSAYANGYFSYRARKF